METHTHSYTATAMQAILTVDAVERSMLDIFSHSVRPTKTLDMDERIGGREETVWQLGKRLSELSRVGKFCGPGAISADPRMMKPAERVQVDSCVSPRSVNFTVYRRGWVKKQSVACWRICEKEQTLWERRCGLWRDSTGTRHYVSRDACNHVNSKYGIYISLQSLRLRSVNLFPGDTESPDVAQIQILRKNSQNRNQHPCPPPHQKQTLAAEHPHVESAKNLPATR